MISNGGFETGDSCGWLFFDASNSSNGGTVAVTDTDSNGGTYSVKVSSVQQKNPAIKEERFAIGTVAPNQALTLTFDYKTLAFADGPVIFVKAVSEGAGGDAVNLEQNITVAAPDWTTQTYNFTTSADVTNGISLEMVVICGGAATCDGQVLFDNVSITID